MQVKLIFEDGQTQEQDTPADSTEALRAFATKMFMRRWPVPLSRIEASVVVSYGISVDGEGDLHVETIGGLIAATPTISVASAPVASAPVRTSAPPVRESSHEPIQEARAASQQPPPIPGRTKLPDSVQKPGETRYEPSDQEKSAGFELVALYDAPIIMMYQPLIDNPTVPLNRDQRIPTLGFMDRKVAKSQFTPDSRMRLVMCKMPDDKVMLLPDYDLLAPVVNEAQKRHATGNGPVPETVPIQYMGDREGHTETMGVTEHVDPKTGQKNQIMVGTIPDRVPLQTG